MEADEITPAATLHIEGNPTDSPPAASGWILNGFDATWEGTAAAALTRFPLAAFNKLDTPAGVSDV